MKNQNFFKRALISIMGLIIVLNCFAQTNREKKAERSELRKSEKQNDFESLSKLINSRNFIFKSGISENKQTSNMYEKQEQGKTAIRINGSLIRVTGLNSSEWWKNTSGKIDSWELTENPEESSYAISFIAHTPETTTSFLIKIFNDKTAIAQFGGRVFRGQVTRN